MTTETSGLEVALGALPSAAAVEQPEAVGPFRVLKRLAQDSAGVVYEAVQSDPNRIVPLRVLPQRRITDAARRRAERLADVMVRLDHAGIACVYQVGGTSESDPTPLFFATERVLGRPITHYAQETKLTLEERLELLARVCDAVSHAHQRGLLHCSLRPGNVLVDASGRVKVLDLGVASVLEGDAQTISLKDRDDWAAALPYMSPEQTIFDWRDLDIRCDVYSLGVIGYELLCGRVPFPAEGRTLSHALHATYYEEITPPACVDRSLRGDLDAILRKALKRERNERYDSASALAADLRRFLADEPVSAHPSTARYHFVKFARRHRLLVASAVCVVGALAAGVVGTSAALLHGRSTAGNPQLATPSLDVRLHIGEGLVNEASALQRAGLVGDAARKYEEAYQELDGVKRMVADTAMAGFYFESPPPLNVFSTGSFRVRGIAFAPDGTSLWVGLESGTIIPYDVRTGRPIREPQQTKEKLTAVAFAPAAHKALLATEKDVWAWDIDSKSAPRKLCDHGAKQAGGCEGGSALLVDFGGQLELCDLASNKTTPLGRAHDEAVACAALCPDGHVVTGSASDGVLRMWERNRGALVRDFHGQREGVQCVAVSPDGKLMLSGDGEGTVRLWDIMRGVVVKTLRAHRSVVTAVCFSAEGSLAASSASDGSVAVWDLSNAGPVRSLPGASNTEAAVFTGDDGQLLYLSGGTLRRTPGGVTVAAQLPPFEHVRCMAVARESGSIVVGSDDGKVRVLDRGGQLVETHDLAPGSSNRAAVTAVAVSHDGKTIFCGLKDGRVAALSDGRVLVPEQDGAGHVARVNCVAISSDGRRALSGSDDALSLWQIQDGKLVGRRFSAEHVTAVALSLDGKRGASGTHDKQLTVWACDTGQRRMEVAGHHAGITSLAFWADGNWLLSGDSRGTMLLSELNWGEHTGARQVGMLPQADGAIVSIAAGSDGWRALTSSGQLWDFSQRTVELCRTWDRQLMAVPSTRPAGPSADSRREWYAFRGRTAWAESPNAGDAVHAAALIGPASGHPSQR